VNPFLTDALQDFSSAAAVRSLNFEPEGEVYPREATLATISALVISAFPRQPAA